MAAIDKLYLKTYYEYDQLKTWAIMYYPKLLLFFYNRDLHYNDFVRECEEWIENVKTTIKQQYAKYADLTMEMAIEKLREEYRRTGYKCSYSQAEEEITYLYNEYHKTDEQLEDDYSFPVMSTPLSVDRRLKWICPLPFVRKYLHEQCGVNPKWEWFYKIFWRGKKYFL